MKRILYTWLTATAEEIESWEDLQARSQPVSPFLELLTEENFDLAVIFRPPGMEFLEELLPRLKAKALSWGDVKFVYWPVSAEAAEGRFEPVMDTVAACFRHHWELYPKADHQVVWATDFAPAQVCFFLLERARFREFRLTRVILSDKVREIIRDFEEQVPFYVLPRPQTFAQSRAALEAFAQVSQESSLMKDLISQALLWAPHSDSVLLTGPTGVGKTLFARSIHQAGPRSGKPFVALNCAAIPRDLLESELFGVKKGAYTGAAADKKGALENAHLGTLFLDEVGELTLDHQTKLLKALQEKTFRPLGGNGEVASDFRLICATNRDLERMVEEGAFRGDLLYRIDVGHLDLPGLAQRREEILPLARGFLSRGWTVKLQELHKAEVDLSHLPSEKQFSPPSEAWLVSHPWPGNIREMENLISRVLVLTGSRTLVEVQDLEKACGRRVVEAQGSESSSGTLTIPLVPDLKTMKDHLEDRALAWALEKTAGNLSEASRLLKMDPSWASKKQSGVRNQRV